MRGRISTIKLIITVVDTFDCFRDYEVGDCFHALMAICNKL